MSAYSETAGPQTRGLFPAHILTHHSRKSTGVTNNMINGSVLLQCPNKPTQCASDSHNVQYQDPETDAAKWNSAFIKCMA